MKSHLTGVRDKKIVMAVLHWKQGFLCDKHVSVNVFQYYIFTACEGSVNIMVDLIDCMAFSTLFQLYRGSQSTSPCFPGVLLTISPHKILSKPLPATSHFHCRSNGQQ